MLSRIVSALEVEVNELFVTNLEIGKNKKLLKHLSKDMKGNVNLAMTEVFKRYLI